MSVAAGVIRVDADASFGPSRPVSGAEAISAVARIAALAGVDRSRGVR